MTKKNKLHYYTEEEKAWVEEQYKTYTITELVGMFNEKFNANVSYSALKSMIKIYKFKSGRTGQFQKGQVSYTKGKHWNDYLTKEQQEKALKHCLYNLQFIENEPLPLGTERVGKDNYLYVKVSFDKNKNKRWQLKHHFIWEKANGKIPKGYVLLFADGNNRNFNLDNLVLVSRKDMITINKNNVVVKGQPNLTKVGINLVKLERKINEKQVS